MAETEYNDLATWALAVLKNSDDVCDLVVGGEDGILETGQLSAQALQAAQTTRREDEDNAGQVLAVVVWEKGEGERERTRTAYVSVLIYDRGKGYSNIRVMREAVITALVGQCVLLVRGAMVNHIRHIGRSGHWILEEFDVDAERLDFGGLLIAEHDEYM